MTTPPDRLARAVRALYAARSRPPAADLATQLRYLEADLRELRQRINALFFAVLSAVLVGALERLLT
jgi:hypothetical protein